MAAEEHEAQAPFSAESYFATQPPPPTLDEDVARVRQFIQRQTEARRKVVLVTVSVRFAAILSGRLLVFLIGFACVFVQSGGTTVPLELNV